MKCQSGHFSPETFLLGSFSLLVLSMPHQPQLHRERRWMVAVERTAGCVELGMLGYARVTQLGLVTAGGAHGRCHTWPSTMPKAAWPTTVHNGTIAWQQWGGGLQAGAGGGVLWWRRPFSCNASRICFSVVPRRMRSGAGADEAWNESGMPRRMRSKDEPKSKVWGLKWSLW